MKKKDLGLIWFACTVFIFVSLACSALLPSTPTAAPADTAQPLPTTAVNPEPTNPPADTPDVAATQQTSEVQTRIQKYVTAGYLTSDQGNFSALTDSSSELAKINYLSGKDAGYEEKAGNFAVWSHIKLSSAAPTNYPEYSGCGFIFHLNDNGDSYRAMVTKDRVLIVMCRNKMCSEVGKTKGSGRLSYENSFEADVDLIVNDTSAHVLVDGQSIGDYSLSGDYLTDPGLFGYSIISGTNKDYGTRCEFSNGGIWIPGQ